MIINEQASSSLIINEKDTALFGEAVDTFLTNFWRGVNPFINENGEFHSDLTQFYRDLNPFVTMSGEIGIESIVGIKSIRDIPGVKGVMDYMQYDLGWVQSWELMESPFWRAAIPLVTATGLTILTAGIFSAMCPTIMGISLATMEVAGTSMTVAQVVAGFVGATVGTYIGQIPVKEYIKKVQELDFEKQKIELEKAESELNELEKLSSEANALEIKKAKTEIQTRISELDGEKNKTRNIVVTGGLAVLGGLLATMR